MKESTSPPNNIRYFRQRDGRYNLTRFARKIGVSQATLSNIELGRQKTKDAVLNKISAELGISPELLASSDKSASRVLASFPLTTRQIASSERYLNSISHYRRQAGFPTIAALAKKIEASASYLSRIEHGWTKAGGEILQKLSNALNASPQQLLETSPDMQTTAPRSTIIQPSLADRALKAVVAGNLKELASFAQEAGKSIKAHPARDNSLLIELIVMIGEYAANKKLFHHNKIRDALVLAAAHAPPKSDFERRAVSLWSDYPAYELSPFMGCIKPNAKTRALAIVFSALSHAAPKSGLERRAIAYLAREIGIYPDAARDPAVRNSLEQSGIDRWAKGPLSHYDILETCRAAPNSAFDQRTAIAWAEIMKDPENCFSKIHEMVEKAVPNSLLQQQAISLWPVHRAALASKNPSGALYHVHHIACRAEPGSIVEQLALEGVADGMEEVYADKAGKYKDKKNTALPYYLVFDYAAGRLNRNSAGRDDAIAAAGSALEQQIVTGWAKCFDAYYIVNPDDARRIATNVSEYDPQSVLAQKAREKLAEVDKPPEPLAPLVPAALLELRARLADQRLS